MQRAKKIEKATGVDTPEPFKTSEIGYTGNTIYNGISLEQKERDLQFPAAINTFKEMAMHPAISSALNLYEAMVNKASYRILPPKNPSKKEKKQADIVSQMLFEDMQVSFSDVVKEALTMSQYGFSVFEKVYRKRNAAEGSVFSDNLIAPKKIAFRNQATIEKFVFDDSGNEIIGVKQNLTGVADPYGRNSAREKNIVVLPRKKFLLFNLGRNKSNPYGTSPLVYAYSHWKLLTYFEEIEAAGVAKDLQGLPVMRIPAQYMAPDASDDQKLLYENFKNILRNLQQNSQSGLILPSTMDEMTKQPLFDIELLADAGGKRSYDIDKIKNYYKVMIFIALSADLLLMGTTSTGSFNLGSIKSSMTGAFIENMIKTVVDAVNDDLIRQIYELNGWDVSRRCKLDYEGFDEVNLDELSKFYQRLGATGYLPQTHDVINVALDAIGVDKIPEGQPLNLPEKTTRSGDGMKEGLGSGTGEASGASGDASSTNSDNAA